MKFIVQDPFSIKKVLIFGSFGLCRFQHKVGMNSFPMRMNVFSYGTNSFPWGMYSFHSKVPIVLGYGSNMFHLKSGLLKYIVDQGNLMIEQREQLINVLIKIDKFRN